MVPFWNKIISDPSRRRRSTVLKLLFYFTRGSITKWNKIILENGRSSGARSVAQAPSGAWKACCSPSLACHRRPAGACRRRLAITVDKCCDWLQQLPHEYSDMSCCDVSLKLHALGYISVAETKVYLHKNAVQRLLLTPLIDNYTCAVYGPFLGFV